MIQGNAGARRQDEPKPGPEKKKAVKNLAVGFCGWRPLWIKASSWSGEHSLPKNITQGCCGSHFWLHIHCVSGSGNPFTSLLHHFFLHPPTTGADQWSFIARRPRTATELVTSAPKLVSLPVNSCWLSAQPAVPAASLAGKKAHRKKCLIWDHWKTMPEMPVYGMWSEYLRFSVTALNHKFCSTLPIKYSDCISQSWFNMLFVVVEVW